LRQIFETRKKDFPKSNSKIDTEMMVLNKFPMFFKSIEQIVEMMKLLGLIAGWLY
jgi:hypothetical protein